MKNPDYEKAVELGINLDGTNRWETGSAHHPSSLRLLNFLREHDGADYDYYFDWKMGGDGDIGEELAYQLDAFFEMLDKSQDTL